MLELTDKNFDEVITGSELPVLVDFHAEWCGPCKMLSPIIEQLELDYEGQLLVCKADVEETSDTTKEYSIAGVPAILIFKDGKIVSKNVGLRTKKDIEQDINEVVE